MIGAIRFALMLPLGAEKVPEVGPEERIPIPIEIGATHFRIGDCGQLPSILRLNDGGIVPIGREDPDTCLGELLSGIGVSVLFFDDLPWFLFAAILAARVHEPLRNP